MKKIFFFTLLVVIAMSSSANAVTRCQEREMAKCMRSSSTKAEARAAYMEQGEYCSLVALQACGDLVR